MLWGKPAPLPRRGLTASLPMGNLLPQVLLGYHVSSPPKPAREADRVVVEPLGLLVSCNQIRHDKLLRSSLTRSPGANARPFVAIIVDHPILQIVTLSLSVFALMLELPAPFVSLPKYDIADL